MHYQLGRREKRVALALLALGAVLRFAFLYLHWFEPVGAEAFNVAVSVARTGAYANPYMGPSGPTAHVLPIPVLLASVVYRLLGAGTRPAELVLSVWSIGLALSAFACMFVLFRRAGVRAVSALAGLAACCCFLPNFGLETVSFRVWEGGLAVATSAALLLALVSLDRSDRHPTNSAVMMLAVAAAVVFLISPQLGLGCYAAMALLFVRRLSVRRWPGLLAIAAAAFALVLAPWLFRNEEVLGAPVLRSNIGLELSIAFYPAAVHTADQSATFMERMREVHPGSSRLAFTAMKAEGGELPYSAGLLRITERWMAAHPGDTTRLAGRHLRQFLFPPTWFYRSSDPLHDRALLLKAATRWLISAFGIIGIARQLIAEPRNALSYVAILVVVVFPLYTIVQPTVRYSYVLFVPLGFYAADALIRLTGRGRRSAALLDAIDRRLATPTVRHRAAGGA